MIRDSAGIRIVETSRDEITSTGECPIAAAPSVTIGTAASGGPTDLFDVVDAATLSDGRIGILNRGSKDLRIFDAAGRFEVAFGRHGEGPGEFSDPIEFDRYRGDSIVVWDWDLGRLSFFDGSGVFGRSVQLDPPVRNPNGVISAGRFSGEIAVGARVVRPFSDPGTFVQQFQQVLSYDARGHLVDTLATLPDGQRTLIDPATRQSGEPLFQSRGRFDASDGRLFLADGDDPQVAIHEGERLVALARWRPGSRRVTQADVETYKRGRLAGVDEGWRRLVGASLDRVPVSDSFPAVQQVMAAADGHVWVREYPRPGRDLETWLRFDADASFVCRLLLPGRPRVMEFGEASALLLTTDELDVEFMERYDIETP